MTVNDSQRQCRMAVSPWAIAEAGAAREQVQAPADQAGRGPLAVHLPGGFRQLRARCCGLLQLSARACGPSRWTPAPRPATTAWRSPSRRRRWRRTRPAGETDRLTLSARGVKRVGRHSRCILIQAYFFHGGVFFLGLHFFRHKFAENGSQDLKMV